jgi:uncharacterized protein
VTEPVIVDTGPIVAFLQGNERHHAWARAQFATIRPPLLTCEPVLTETLFLLSRIPGGKDALFGLLERGVLGLAFDLKPELSAVKRLMQRYADVPMSLADACLVRMSEIHNQSRIFTLDSDFKVYRRHGRQVVPLILPGLPPQ